MPGTSLEKLVTVEDRLAQDTEYMKAGTAFLNTPAENRRYDRIESSFCRHLRRSRG